MEKTDPIGDDAAINRENKFPNLAEYRCLSAILKMIDVEAQTVRITNPAHSHRERPWQRFIFRTNNTARPSLPLRLDTDDVKIAVGEAFNVWPASIKRDRRRRTSATTLRLTISEALRVSAILAASVCGLPQP